MKTLKSTTLPRTFRTLGAGLILLALAGAVSCSAAGPQDPASMSKAPQSGSAAATAPASPAIEGIQVYDNLTSDHVKTPVTYPQSPGVGGDHSPVWTNCGIYTEPVEQMRAVHSMEHGAVWVTYRPDLTAAQVQKLTELVGPKSYTVLSPNPDQTSPVTATAWGIQLPLDDPSDARLEQFLTTYIQGEQTPEPGAPCTGSVDG